MSNQIAATACRGSRQGGRKFLQRFTETVIQPVGKRPLEEARPQAVQDVLAGRFVIEHELGRGASGCVYSARDLDLGRRVAIKLIECRPDPRKLERFRREARAVALIEHPNVLAIHDARLDDSRPFLVTELLEGQTLRDRLDEGPFTLRRALDLALQLARGLAAAHDGGVVHRDLKPSNLFVTCKGRLKILDFGIARLSAQESPMDRVGTEAGAIFGTVGYMSPEQVRGEAADARSDIFAAGCLLLEMITGEQCFLRRSAIETNFAILREEPPLLPGRTPSLVSDVVRRCLQKDPALRFQTGQELASALRRCRGQVAPFASDERSRATASSASRYVVHEADGYFSESKGVTLSSTQTLSFQLTPPQTGKPPCPGAVTIGFGGLASGTVTSYSESGFSVSAVSGEWVASTGFGHPAPSDPVRRRTRESRASQGQHTSARKNHVRTNNLRRN